MDYLYENDRYFVDVELASDEVDLSIEVGGVRYEDYYIVCNKESGIVELKTNNLIEAISMAASCDVTLQKQPWTWYYSQLADEQAVEGQLPGESPLVVN